jgi:hypothetical protein
LYVTHYLLSLSLSFDLPVVDSVDNVEEYSERNNWAYVLFTAVNGFSLFLLTCSVLIYGRILAKRFVVEPHRSVSKTETRKKYQSLLRINAILGICCICFFLRVVCLSIAISDSFGTQIEEKYFHPIWWFLLNSWIPTIPVRLTVILMSISLSPKGWTLLYTWRSKRQASNPRVVYGAPAPGVSSDHKQTLGSSTLSSDDLTGPLLRQQQSELLSYYTSGFSDNESDAHSSSYHVDTTSGDFDEEKYREDSAHEAYLQHTRNLIEERLSAYD